MQKRILSRRTTADVLSHFKGVQRRENSFMYEDIGGFETEGSIYYAYYYYTFLYNACQVLLTDRLW